MEIINWDWKAELGTKEQFEKALSERQLQEAEEYFWSHLAKNNEDEKGRDEYLARLSK